MADKVGSVNYGDLFEIWADFDDADAPSEVTSLIEEMGLGSVDAVSFMAFCHGYEKAIEKTGQAMEKTDRSKPAVRFIDSQGQTLFFVADGGEIEVETADGTKVRNVCRFIDDHHTKVGERVYHISEFAQAMELYGSAYRPIRNQGGENA